MNAVAQAALAGAGLGLCVAAWARRLGAWWRPRHKTTHTLFAWAASLTITAPLAAAACAAALNAGIVAWAAASTLSWALVGVWLYAPRREP